MPVVTQLIKRQQFYGAEKLYTREKDGLTYLLRGIARTQAQMALNAKITAMVDNSGGVPFANGVVPLIQSAFTGITQAGSNAVSKANMDAAFLAVNQAIADLVAQFILVNGVVQIFPTNFLVNNTGLVGVGTIAAIPLTFAGVNAAEAQVAGSSTLLAAAVSALNLLITVANSFVPAVINVGRSASAGNSSVFPLPTGGVASFGPVSPDLPGYVITDVFPDAFLTSAGFVAMSANSGVQSDGVPLSQVATPEAVTVFTQLANTVATLRQTANNLRVLTYPLPVAAV